MSDDRARSRWEAARTIVDGWQNGRKPLGHLVDDIADAILAAEARGRATADERINELQAALRPFARFAEGFGPHGREDGWVLANNVSRTKQITMGDVRAAQRALAESVASAARVEHER